MSRRRIYDGFADGPVALAPAPPSWDYSPEIPHEASRRPKAAAAQQSLAHLEPMISSGPSTSWAPTAPERTRRVAASPHAQAFAHLEPTIKEDTSAAWWPTAPEKTAHLRLAGLLDPSPPVLVTLTPPELAQFQAAIAPEMTRRAVRLRAGEFLDSLVSPASITPEKWAPLFPGTTRRVPILSRGGLAEPIHVPPPPPPAMYDLSYPVSGVDRTIEVVDVELPPPAPPVALTHLYEPIAPQRTRLVRILTRGGEWTPWFLVVPPPVSAIIWTAEALFGLDLGDEEAAFGLDLGDADAGFGLDLGEDDAEFGT